MTDLNLSTQENNQLYSFSENICSHLQKHSILKISNNFGAILTNAYGYLRNKHYEYPNFIYGHSFGSSLGNSAEWLLYNVFDCKNNPVRPEQSAYLSNSFFPAAVAAAPFIGYATGYLTEGTIDQAINSATLFTGIVGATFSGLDTAEFIWNVIFR